MTQRLHIGGTSWAALATAGSQASSASSDNCRSRSTVGDGSLDWRPGTTDRFAGRTDVVDEWDQLGDVMGRRPPVSLRAGAMPCRRR